MENYTSLQEFNESTSSRGRAPILSESQPSPEEGGARRGLECMRSRANAVLVTVLLLSVCANIALGVLSYSRSSNTAGFRTGTVREISDVPQKYSLLTRRYAMLCEDYYALGKNCTDPAVEVKRCSPCPQTWIPFEDKCYFFSKDKMDWQSSNVSCESMGGHLAILHSHRQHDVLEQEVRRLKMTEQYFWIGLSDKENEGDWRWVDNSPVNITYWGTTEPDNHQSGGIHGEDCAVLNSIHKYWSDVPCEFHYKRICEMDAVKLD